MDPSACMPDIRDYTYMWWAHGWRSPKKVLCFQTGYYGMAVDVKKVRLLNLGVIAKPEPYGPAVSQSNDAVFKLPKARFKLSVRAGNTWYTCTGSDAPASRIIESGRFVQRADIEQLVFKDERGKKFNAAGRLEIVAWPDRLSLILDVTPNKAYQRAEMAMEVHVPGHSRVMTSNYSANADGWQVGKTRRVDMQLRPVVAPGPKMPWTAVPARKISWETVRSLPPNADPPGRVEVTQIKAKGKITARYDADRQWHYIPMPRKAWHDKPPGDRLDRVKVKLTNPADKPKAFRLMFAKDGGVPHITGLTPILRDAAGNPTGIPVQISKNWHRKPDETFLYQGPWLHAFTLVRVPAHSSLDCELAIAHAYWGGVPAVSHAQLCLVGWGIDQLWDQSAVGSWGESICYDPDVNLQRGMIDDVRPLMVWATGHRKNVKWGWTQNVGGGDFGDYRPDGGGRHFFGRMRTQYEQCGPCLTDVTYAGVSPDGAISMRATVSSPRCDDIVRAYYHVRYDFHKATKPKRLELFRLGADRYNDPNASRIAYGKGRKLTKEIRATGRPGYQTTFPLKGPGSWIALYRSTNDPGKGAWANRGFILRAWKARVGGKPTRRQLGAIIGTSQGGHASANLVTDSNAFKPGDFVEFTVEMVVLPVRAGDYYGPNKALRAHLAKHPDSWQPVARQAAGNTLKTTVKRGRLERPYPPMIRVRRQPVRRVQRHRRTRLRAADAHRPDRL